jgi:histidinol-phosphate phosphatase family protein
VSSPRPAVFLDRDGTLNIERELVRTPQDLTLHEGAGAALLALQKEGYALIVVTNQSAIARGTLREQELALVHSCLRQLLASEGVTLDDIIHCPHHPTEGEPPLKRSCDCRKPGPGMIKEAALKHDLDLDRSWMIGDNITDIEAAERAGVHSLLVKTGKGAQFSGQLPEAQVVSDLSTAAARIISER